MKTIENWEAIEIIDGIEKIALPLPGCKIKGEIEGKIETIETQDVNLTRLIVKDINGEKYYLSGARQSYIDLLNDVMELSNNNDIER